MRIVDCSVDICNHYRCLYTIIHYRTTQIQYDYAVNQRLQRPKCRLQTTSFLYMRHGRIKYAKIQLLFVFTSPVVGVVSIQYTQAYILQLILLLTGRRSSDRHLIQHIHRSKLLRIYDGCYPVLGFRELPPANI